MREVVSGGNNTSYSVYLRSEKPHGLFVAALRRADQKLVTLFDESVTAEELCRMHKLAAEQEKRHA